MPGESPNLRALRPTEQTAGGRRLLPPLPCKTDVHGQRDGVDSSSSPSQPLSSSLSKAKQGRKEHEQVKGQVQVQVQSQSMCRHQVGDEEQVQTVAPFTQNVSASATCSDIVGNISHGFTPGNDAAANNGILTPNADILPTFKPAVQPNFRWGAKEGVEFVQSVQAAYEEVVHWRRNVFLVPSGKVGKEFISELTRLFNAYTEITALESVAMESIMLACVLLLQKPHIASKSRDHIAALERRLRAWRAGDVEGLLKEGRTIQHCLPPYGGAESAKEREEKRATTFARLVLAGKMHAAIRYLSDSNHNGLLSLDELCGTENVRSVLAEKHPEARPVQKDALLSTEEMDLQTVHPVLFEQITADKVRSAALRIKGTAGPSGVDAAGWRRILVSFHRESDNLCTAIAAFTRRICTDYLDPTSLRAFVACRLVPLNKNPGVRPIGICEVLRRLVGKVIMTVVGHDVLKATGPIQLCAGHEAGAESAIHAMRTLFAEEGTDAVILVDASNAFNNLNRKVALLNIRVLCPAIATALINCYRGNGLLFVGGETLLCQEGTTQGDPLAMAMFALASVPLIKKVATIGATQAWFADDAASGGKMISIRRWWDRLVLHGPQYGYFPNALKTTVITKEDRHCEVVKVFEGTGISITDVGKRYLGGALGSQAFLEKFVETKISEWTLEIERLSDFAKSQPHAAFAAFSHGISHRWTYLTRVLPISGHLLSPLEKVIRLVFLPELTGQPACSDKIRRLLALPPRLGGLGITNPVTSSHYQHAASTNICKPLVKAILDQEGEPFKIRGHQQQRKAEEKRKHGLAQKEECNALMEEFTSSPDLQETIKAASEKGASAWLTALPIEEHGFALHKGAFRDALALRYGWPLKFCAEKCLCGARFEPDHQMICKQGGYASLRHNELRDLTATLMRKVCNDVRVEPPLQPVTGEHLPRSANREEGARLDVRARGFWDGSSQDAFFDVRVFHPFSPSYRSTSLSALYRQHEMKKKKEYGSRVREIERGCFTPLVFSTTGGMGREAEIVFKRLASLISNKSGESYAVVMGWIRTSLSFSLLRSALMCLRNTRPKPAKFNEDTCISVVSAEANVKEFM